MELKEEIQRIVELLYQQNMTVAYKQLLICIPKIDAYIVGLEQEQQVELIDVLRTALEMMEQGDITTLADVLQYEFIEKL